MKTLRLYIILILTMTNLLLFISLFFLKEFKECYPPVRPTPKVTNNLKFESIDAIVTAYSSTEQETDSTPFITASGYDLRGGKNVIANNCLEFGSAVILNGKTYFVEDRMNARYSCQYFDVYMPTGAKEFGKQFINLTILK